MALIQSLKRRRNRSMQMMIEPQEPEYIPRHMRRKAIEVTLKGLRQLVDELPEGVILSVNPREVSDGQENG
jgi:hypothetical protein